ncbi:MAG: MFS transporter [Bacillota bacterium]
MERKALGMDPTTETITTAAKTPQEIPTGSEEQLQTGPMAVLVGTHALNDSYTSFLSNLLPLLMDKFGLSYALAGLLQSVLNISTSLAQPVFGFLTDRSKRVPFIILGPAFTALAISSLGLMPSYPMLFPALIIGGLSTAAFHPQATSVVPLVGGSRRGMAMALFVVGGTVGYAVGPLLILSIVGKWGLGSTWLAAVPTLVLVGLLGRHVPRTVYGFARRTVEQASGSALLSHWKPLLVMWFIVVFRSGVATTMAGFLPTFLHDSKGFAVGMATATAHLVFTATGAVGGLLAGHLSDTVSRRAVITVGLLSTVPAMLALLHAEGLWIWPLLMLTGCLLQSTNPVLVIMAQELVPGNSGTAAGLMMGLGWAVGGVFTWLVGLLGDHFQDLTLSLSFTVFLLLIAAALVRYVPDRNAR